MKLHIVKLLNVNLLTMKPLIVNLLTVKLFSV